MAYIVSMRDLVDEGLELRAGQSDESKLRMKELRSYCTFIERELPGFVARWEKEWEEESKA